jgi:hypothetical protein
MVTDSTYILNFQKVVNGDCLSLLSLIPAINLLFNLNILARYYRQKAAHEIKLYQYGSDKIKKDKFDYKLSFFNFVERNNQTSKSPDPFQTLLIIIKL